MVYEEVSMKKQLTIVTNPKNDKGSVSYVKSIKRIAKEQFADEINILEAKVRTQEEFETLLNSPFCEGKVLCIEPHDFVFNETNYHRNAENMQVVDAVIDLLHHYDDYKFKKILIVGRGAIGQELDYRLQNMAKIVCMARYRDRDRLNKEFVNQFDAVINCGPADSEIKLFYTGLLIDVAGTFKVETETHADIEDNVEVTKTPQCDIIKRGTIGKATTYKMLDEVVNGNESR